MSQLETTGTLNWKKKKQLEHSEWRRNIMGKPQITPELINLRTPGCSGQTLSPGWGGGGGGGDNRHLPRDLKNQER